MDAKNYLVSENITNKIYRVRNIQVMLDSNLAELYEVQTKRINEAVKRNDTKFPHDLMFELTKNEVEALRSQNATFNESVKGRKYLPKVFTEQGVYMLATVLKSKVATEVTLSIMRTFTQMKNFLSENASIVRRLETLEKRQIGFELSTNEQINQIFKALEHKEQIATEGVFYDGEIFDAYHFVATLIRGAKKSIILIDNYVDDTVLTLFSKNQDINITIYTHTISKQLQQDLQKYNAQYKKIEIKKFQSSHDRFMIIDEEEIYHIGASLKDLGKKWFAFSKLDIKSFDMLNRLGIK